MHTAGRQHTSIAQPMLALLSVTFALLVNEIMLSAIFNVTVGAVNTVVAISAALLGLSSSGIVVYVSPQLRRQASSPEAVYAWLPAFVLSTFASMLIIMNLPINHADFLYAPTPGRLALLPVAYLAAIIPFFIGGVCINLILLQHGARIAELYFADLAGAALGCIGAVLMLSPLGAPRAVLYGTLPAALVGVWHAARHRPGWWRRVLLLLLPFVLVETTARVVPLLQVKRFNTLGAVDQPQFRGFNAGRDALEFERWSLDAWTIIRSERIPQQWENFRGWGVSRNYHGPVPRLRLINYNLRFSTYVTEFDGDLSKIRDWLDADLISLHYQLGRPYARVLNIGAGGGREVLNALNHGASDITAVDISEVTVDELMRGRLREFSGGLFFHPQVHALADEGRSFVQRSPQTYDLIDFTIVGGANLEKLDVMKVEDLFTREALRTYWSHLAPGGVFSYVMYDLREDLVSEWSRQPIAAVPYIPAMKTLAGLRQVFEEREPDGRFADHVLVAGVRGVIDPHSDLVHIVASTTPFTDDERARFVARCRELDFLTFYPPAADTGGNLYQRIIEADSLSGLDATLPFSIAPATDDRPFQYAFRWRSAREALLLLITNPLVLTALGFGGLAIVLCFGPLLGRERAGADLREMWRLLGFFAAIGSGYMLIEIAVLLKFQLYFGRPVLALSVGLFAFLLASGAGSRFTARISAAAMARAVSLAVAWSIAYGLLFRIAWPHVLNATISLPTIWRAAIAVAIIVPLAAPMGMLLPLGVRLIGDDRRGFLPWAWATNGCFSVFGIFASRIAGLFWGFDRALLIGFGVYVIAALCAVAHARARRVGAQSPPSAYSARGHAAVDVSSRVR
jgi:SAM-dependent methyltransferase